MNMILQVKGHSKIKLLLHSPLRKLLSYQDNRKAIHMKYIFTFILGILCSFLASAVSITPAVFVALPSSLPECSGLDYCGSGRFWMHNDGYGDNKIYKVNNLGDVTRTVTVNGVTNYDWEDLAHDFNRNYMYIGDFGNNICDRTNLRIFRINHPQNFTGSTVTAEVINFSYPDQTHFPSPWMNFDAEGFFHYNGKLYLFTKPDGSAIGYTKLYTIPDQPGTYVATLVDSFYTNDRITSADINSDASAAIISTNNHIHIFTGWNGENIFSGTHRLISIAGSWTQKEAIAFKDINHVYMTDEDNGSGNNIYSIDLSTWIVDMTMSIDNIVSSSSTKVNAFPNPANDQVNFQVTGPDRSAASIQLFDIAGNKITEAKMNGATGMLTIRTADLPGGVYFYRLFENNQAIQTQRLIVAH